MQARPFGISNWPRFVEFDVCGARSKTTNLAGFGCFWFVRSVSAGAALQTGCRCTMLRGMGELVTALT